MALAENNFEEIKQRVFKAYKNEDPVRKVSWICQTNLKWCQTNLFMTQTARLKLAKTERNATNHLAVCI